MVKEKRAQLLLHPIRRDIYRIISETPGSYFFEIASNLELAHGTLSWHLRALEEAGLIETIRFAGRRVFFSKNLRNAEIEKAFVVLKSKATQNVFTYVMNNNGCYQAQIAEALGQHHDTVRHHIQRLKKAKLIDSIKQGRTVRYALGEVGKIILNSNTEMFSKAFIEYLFARLKEECLIPEVVELDGNRLTIRVSCPGKDDAYLSLELQNWEFVLDDDDDEEEEESDGEKPEVALESGDLDDDEDPSKPKVVKDFTRRPKIVKVE